MRPTPLFCALVVVVCGLMPGRVSADPIEVILIGQDLQVTQTRLVTLDQQYVSTRPAGGAARTDAVSDFIALAAVNVTPALPGTGLLVLADGQQLPGEALEDDNAEDVLVWRHPWLGRIDVPIDDVANVRFRAGVSLPEPSNADVVLLANGDRLEGFIVALGDPVVLEVQRGDAVSLLELPLRNVASVRMVAPQQEPSGVRVWLADGTIIDAHAVQIEDNGRARLTSTWHGPDDAPTRLMTSEITAILLDPSTLTPLADIPPQRVEGPMTRYEIPAPMVREEAAVLGLSSIEYRGPLVVHYVLPRGTSRFAAEAILPDTAQPWGDFELIVRSAGEVLFQTRMNASNPSVNINIELPASEAGRELTVEMLEGAYGPINDRLILQRPMLLVQPPS